MNFLFPKKQKTGFTHTPILASLLGVLNGFYEIFYDFKKKLCSFLYSRDDKNTMPKLVSGFTLVEMLIYIALMTTITLIVVQSLVVVLKSNRASFSEVNLRNSGYSAMEAMLREIKLSETIDQVSGGVLQMRQDSGANIVQFATTSESQLNFYEGAVTPTLIGPLTSKNVFVKELIFTEINTGKSLAVRIQMNLEIIADNQTKNEWFYSTAVLRGSY